VSGEVPVPDQPLPNATLEHQRPYRFLPPISFAHRGDRAFAQENTLLAFQQALAKGATGLESDVWVTADGIAVLDHDGIVVSRFRKRAISDHTRSQLPAHIPSLGDLYAACGTGFQLSLDLKDPAALDPVLATCRAAGAATQMWLCSPTWESLASNRGKAHDIRLVDSTRLKRLKDGPERHGSRLANAGIDAINMHYTDWTAGLTALFHRFDRTCFGWDAQHERIISELTEMKIDGVYCDDAAKMVAVLTNGP
jgi:glycerophosphoryl diester phosphodiesterase